MRVNDAMVGHVPEREEWRWRSRNDYYLNCLLEVDGHIGKMLDELDARGLTSSTIVVLTSDHGEFGGAHRLIGKGGTSYREQNNVPLMVSHPAYAGGKRCKAVTSHLDIAPTLVSLTNASADKKVAITKKLPGKDFARLLAAPEIAGHDAVRDGQLFCFNMFLTLDGDFAEKASQLLREPGGKEKFKLAGLKPNLANRGAIRSVFDGRYQFTRYFSPKQHNRPTAIDALFKLNDVELFDLQADPNEMDNLAMAPRKNADLLAAMNAKLNRLIDTEVGEDVGQMLPGGIDAGWVATPAVNDI
jgi:arylsulfatase